MSQQTGLPLEFKLLLKGKFVGYESHIQTGFHNTFEIFQGKTGKDNDWWRAYSYLWIEHDEKRQWTGFKDKNRKKIYFGDKMKHFDDIFVIIINDMGNIVAINKNNSQRNAGKHFHKMELTDG